MPRLEAIYLGPRRREPLIAVESVRAVPGLGLEGDRYFLRRGSLSRWPRPERAVSLIALETVEALLALGMDLRDGRHRRNLVVSGFDLDGLRGVTFWVGEVLLKGGGPCAPCGYLETLTTAGVFEALRGRGGIRCEVLTEGVLRVGDEIQRATS